MITFPAFDRAVTDNDRVSNRSLRVYRHVLEFLEFREFRAVKLIRVAAELRMKREHVSGALKQLTDLGYLRRGERAWPGGPFTYELVWSLPRDDDPQTVTGQVA